MLRNFAAAAVVLGVSLGLAMADPVTGRITSVEGKKVTIMVGAKKDVKGEEKKFDIADGVKVNKASKDGEKTALADGLGAAELKNIDSAKGIGATLEVKDGKVVEITLKMKKK